jgi:transglutaminase-like putative cysteine protease
VPPLASDARKEVLGKSKNLDFEAESFQKWLDKNALRRRAGEGEVEFARRVFLHIRKHYKYDYREDLKREASVVCTARATDCGGMAILFVAALRANKLPARLLCGRWAESAVKGEKVGGVAYYKGHVKAEFHADGIGWVPVDLSSGVLHDKTAAGLEYFGKDPGDFLVLHVDPDLLLDSIHFGEKAVEVLQSAGYWVTGSGSLDPTTVHESWRLCCANTAKLSCSISCKRKT